MELRRSALCRPDLARDWPLGLGLLLLAVLWLGPLPGAARTSFSSHMILHLGVMVVAAPLVALGLARLVPMPARMPLVWLAVAGSVAEFVVVWGWHAPALHAAAGFIPAGFALQQASFLLAGVLVWLAGFAARGRGGAAAGLVAMLMCFMHMSMLGVLLATTPRLVYAPELCGGGFGLGPLDDQRLGGVLMAVGGGLPYFGGAVFFAHRLIGAERDP